MKSSGRSDPTNERLWNVDTDCWMLAAAMISARDGVQSHPPLRPSARWR